MPIYEYMPDGPGCAYCEGGFEVIHKRGERLEACPECGQACHRVMSTFATFRPDSAIVSDRNSAEKGFTKYRRIEKGRYEKVSGSGPELINDPG